MSIAIRKPRESDAYSVAQVEIDVWRDTYPTLLPAEYLVDRLDIVRVSALWARRLQDLNFRQCCRLAVSADGNIVGFITFGKTRDPGRDSDRDSELSSDGEIYEVYVLTDFQNRGLGRQLCHVAAGCLRHEGARSMTVEVLEGNPARFFYEALGGRMARRKNRPFAGLRLPSLIYVWENIGALVSESN